MAVTETNRLRWRAILIARHIKTLLGAIPAVLGFARPRWFWRWMFLGPDGKPHRPGEIILADLREFARLPGNRFNLSTFDTDPLVMARRAGRQEVVMRIINYLNLDETDVQQLMELDDGIGN